MRSRMLWVAVALFLAMSAEARQAAPTYVTLWFDAEDYILPEDDDATLRLAEMLTRAGVKATFKVVGEKARILEQRGRTDVIQALKQHDIGYHSNTHSQQPTIAVYLQHAGWEDGIAEFERREGPGSRDLARIFGAHSGRLRPARQRLGAAVLPGAALDGHRDVSRRGRPGRPGRPAVLLRRDAQRLQDAIDARAHGARRRIEPGRGKDGIREGSGCASRQGRRNDQHLLPPVGMGARRVLGCRQLQSRRQSRARRLEAAAYAAGGRDRAGLRRLRAVRPLHRPAARRPFRDRNRSDAPVRRCCGGARLHARGPAIPRAQRPAGDHLPAPRGVRAVERRCLRPARGRGGRVRRRPAPCRKRRA